MRWEDNNRIGIVPASRPTTMSSEIDWAKIDARLSARHYSVMLQVCRITAAEIRSCKRIFKFFPSSRRSAPYLIDGAGHATVGESTLGLAGDSDSTPRKYLFSCACCMKKIVIRAPFAIFSCLVAKVLWRPEDRLVVHIFLLVSCFNLLSLSR